MKVLPALPHLVRTAALLMSVTFPAAAQSETAPAHIGWHADTLGQAVGYMLLFALLGIFTAIAGYKLFDKVTPGDLTREIIENKNIAAAIVAAAVIIGVCLIVAASMLG